MKKAIVIGTFPTDKTTEKMLVSCIENAQAFGWDIVLASHKALPQHIVELVDYYVYDKQNILEPIDLTPIYWYHSELFSVEINGNGHIVSVTRNMKNAISLLETLGYGFFYYMESDNVLSKEDVNQLLSFESTMFADQKEMVLFKIGCCDNVRYESLLFGGKPSFFIKSADLPMTINELRKYKVHPTLEDIFYMSFKYIQKNCLIVDGASSKVLSTSGINLIANHHKAEVIKDHDDEKYFLWISNSSDNPDAIKFKINNDDFVEIPPNGYYYQPANIDEIFLVEIIEGIQTINKTFQINELNIPKFAKKGHIKFNR